MRVLRLVSLLVAIVWTGGAAAADRFAPAIVYSFAGKDDGAFNSAAALGVKRFVEHSGVEVREYERGLAVDDLTQGLVAALERGADPLIAVGFAYAPAIEKLAAAHPDRHFVLIDGDVDRPNVVSVLFREEQGAFLVGLLAAKASKTGTIGFLGGMDMPLIRRFECGFRLGARHAAPQVAVLADYHGADGKGFSDPAWGRNAALAQFDKGADVVFAAAGGSGLGSIEAAHERGKLAIGVDTNQNGVRPGTVLTSMLKRVDVAVYRELTQLRRGDWKAGREILGLAEEAVGWALDHHNAALITPEWRAAAARGQSDLIAGTISLTGPEADAVCRAN
ncbi:MAG: BMP family ABC transporter substrate-binding protein [Alphaproteobacteria bacterium]|nr:BMP family ABC transporter substrate-binding protein [Alphaproteobacteria bacterium]